VHPIVECAGDISAALKGVRGVEPVFMGTAEKEAALLALAEARSQLDALRARVLAAADDVGEAHGLRDAAAWLAVQTRTTRREARRDLALGRALEAHAAVGAALSSGVLRTEQARVVVEAVDALPSRVDEETRWRAENVLLALARDHDAGELKQIGKRILDVVAPEVGECHEAAVLAAEEARADAAVELTMNDDGAGRCRGSFVVPSHVGKMLERHLLALANPARHTEADLEDESGGWKPLRRRLGEAFVEYVERYPEDRTPQTAGVSATVVVTMTLSSSSPTTAPRCSTTAPGCPRVRRGGWRARPGSSPRSWAPAPSRSTWAGGPGCSPRPSASPSGSATAAAPPAAARPRPRAATPTTTTPGPEADSPT
jgi:hypothetical protein